ncbi:MAG: MBL fold metallo-hydrolase [Oscillospiraceae bacterium]|jgi:competence protein ComEC|nr:MBL fold metallo-hydrolase [Oscillospiraceae bacterium]
MAQNSKKKSGSKNGQKMGGIGGIIAVIAIVLYFLFSQNSPADTPAQTNSVPGQNASAAAPADVAGQSELPVAAPSETMQMHVIDVGQGSSSLFVSNGKTIMIDAGENGTGKTIINYLNKLGIGSVDLFIGTHPHSDHIGGMDEVMRQIDFKQIIMPTMPKSIVPTTNTYLDVLELIQEQGKSITAANVGDTYDIGAMHLEVLGPVSTYNEINNMSVVSMITFGARRVLVTGDAEKAAERAVIGLNIDLKADIYIAGHHGSSTASTQELLDKVKPSYVAISCGLDNKYGHPHKETIQKLEAMKIPYYRTDLNGNIEFIISDYSIQVELEKK